MSTGMGIPHCETYYHNVQRRESVSMPNYSMESSTYNDEISSVNGEFSSILAVSQCEISIKSSTYTNTDVGMVTACIWVLGDMPILEMRVVSRTGDVTGCVGTSTLARGHSYMQVSQYGTMHRAYWMASVNLSRA